MSDCDDEDFIRIQTIDDVVPESLNQSAPRTMTTPLADLGVCEQQISFVDERRDKLVAVTGTFPLEIRGGF
ncbi:MAG: hypothetical protein AABO58_16960 [Acidobacteriota bacterium]